MEDYVKRWQIARFAAVWPGSLSPGETLDDIISCLSVEYLGSYDRAESFLTLVGFGIPGTRRKQGQISMIQG